MLEEKLRSRLVSLATYLNTAQEQRKACRSGDKMERFWLARINTLNEEIAFLKSILIQEHK